MVEIVYTEWDLIVGRWWRQWCVVWETSSVVHLMTSLTSWVRTSNCSTCSQRFSALNIFIFARKHRGFCPILQVSMSMFLSYLTLADMPTFPLLAEFSRFLSVFPPSRAEFMISRFCWVVLIFALKWKISAWISSVQHRTRLRLATNYIQWPRYSLRRSGWPVYRSSRRTVRDDLYLANHWRLTRGHCNGAVFTNTNQ